MGRAAPRASPSRGHRTGTRPGVIRSAAMSSAIRRPPVAICNRGSSWRGPCFGPATRGTSVGCRRRRYGQVRGSAHPPRPQARGSGCATPKGADRATSVQPGLHKSVTFLCSLWRSLAPCLGRLPAGSPALSIAAWPRIGRRQVTVTDCHQPIATTSLQSEHVVDYAPVNPRAAGPSAVLRSTNLWYRRRCSRNRALSPYPMSAATTGRTPPGRSDQVQDGPPAGPGHLLDHVQRQPPLLP